MKVSTLDGRISVYAITDGVAIKFGTAIHPGRRLQTLQVSHWRELKHVTDARVVNGERIERMIKRFCCRAHIRGEWYWADSYRVQRVVKWLTSMRMRPAIAS